MDKEWRMKMEYKLFIDGESHVESGHLPALQCQL